MMKLGFLSAILPDASLEQVLATAASWGYDCVELACWPVGKSERRYSGVTHIDATKDDDESIAAIGELTNKYSVSISGLGYYPNALSANRDGIVSGRNPVMRLARLGPQSGCWQ